MSRARCIRCAKWDSRCGCTQEQIDFILKANKKINPPSHNIKRLAAPPPRRTVPRGIRR